MKDTKPFWSSWTLWGSVATLVGVLLPNFGLHFSMEEVTSFFSSWQKVLDAVLTFGGIITTIYGRFTADKELTVRRQ